MTTGVWVSRDGRGSGDGHEKKDGPHEKGTGRGVGEEPGVTFSGEKCFRSGPPGRRGA